MSKKRVFISFDYDHDKQLKHLFVGQARNNNSPFEIVDLSIKEAIDSNWKANARRRIKGCDVVLVLCGKHTHTASGVAAEIKIAQEEGIPYFLLKGYKNEICKKPTTAKSTDKIHSWTWNNLELLINGKKQNSRTQALKTTQTPSRKQSPSQKTTGKTKTASKNTHENIWDELVSFLWGKG